MLLLMAGSMGIVLGRASRTMGECRVSLLEPDPVFSRAAVAQLEGSAREHWLDHLSWRYAGAGRCAVGLFPSALVTALVQGAARKSRAGICGRMPDGGFYIAIGCGCISACFPCGKTCRLDQSRPRGSAAAFRERVGKIARGRMGGPEYVQQFC